jgi:hypothetical protein
MWTAQEFASIYSCGILALKLFTLCGGWSADSFFVVVKMWLDQESVVGFFSAMPGLVVVLFWVGFIVTSVFRWMIFKRTTFTLSRRTMIIEERLWSFVTRMEFQRSNIAQFDMAQDEEDALTYEVVADVTGIMLHRCCRINPPCWRAGFVLPSMNG